MSTPFLGQIQQVGFNFAPTGWALCDGSVFPITQNQALFALLGTMYGGDGVRTFALPDLRGRVAVGQGQGPGLSAYVVGQAGGTENVTLNATQMPQHNHTATFTNAGSSFSASTAKASAQLPATGSLLGKSFDTSGASAPAIYVPAGGTASASLGGLNVAGTVAVANAGGGQPFPVIQPYLAVTMIIALQGIFPSRN